MKSVIISIKPYWVFLIIAKTMGWNIAKEKTVEVRKTCPQDNEWNKVGKIYCTKDKKSFNFIPKKYQPFMKRFLGKVIGEFVCDEITKITYCGYDNKRLSIVKENLECQKLDKGFLSRCQLSYEDIEKYANGWDLYGWHISDLVIYEKPRELDEFYVVDKQAVKQCQWRFRTGQTEIATRNGGWIKGGYGCSKLNNPEWCENCLHKPITSAPQSWCYVEEGMNEQKG